MEQFEKYIWNGKEEILEVWKPSGDLMLKPCPFCGENEVIYVQYSTPNGSRWRVTCCGCMATIDPGYAQMRYVVQEKWNRRTSNITKG